MTNKSNLLWQHESGLSSSGYELSQYMADASETYDPVASATWGPVQAGEYLLDQRSWLSLVRRGLGGKSLGKSSFICFCRSPGQRPTLVPFPTFSLVLETAS